MVFIKCDLLTDHGPVRGCNSSRPVFCKISANSVTMDPSLKDAEYDEVDVGVYDSNRLEEEDDEFVPDEYILSKHDPEYYYDDVPPDQDLGEEEYFYLDEEDEEVVQEAEEEEEDDMPMSWVNIELDAEEPVQEQDQGPGLAKGELVQGKTARNQTVGVHCLLK